MSVTQSQIARHVGISRSAVSQVLNGRAHMVSPEVRDRILVAVEEIGYHRNALVRALKSNRTHVIGVIVPPGDGSFFMEIMKGAEIQARARGYQCFFCQSFSEAETFENHVSTLREYRVDGLIIVPTNSDMKLDVFQTMQTQRFPFVLVDNPLDGFETSIVENINAEIGRLGAEHLLKLGHRRIACIRGIQTARTAQQRLEGFRQALRKAKINEDPDLIVGDGFSFKGGLEAVRKLLNESKKFTAIFAHSDLAALGAIRELMRRGLRVPDDISVVGCGNINFSELATPSLTTVDQKPQRIGALAAQMLVEHIEGTRTDICKILIQPELVVRESTAAPAKIEARSRQPRSSNNRGPKAGPEGG